MRSEKIINGAKVLREDGIVWLQFRSKDRTIGLDEVSTFVWSGWQSRCRGRWDDRSTRRICQNYRWPVDANEQGLVVLREPLVLHLCPYLSTQQISPVFIECVTFCYRGIPAVGQNPQVSHRALGLSVECREDPL